MLLGKGRRRSFARPKPRAHGALAVAVLVVAVALAGTSLAAKRADASGHEPAPASRSQLTEDTVSFQGFGPARWGELLSTVEGKLGVSFDCSGGAVPGACLCPTYLPSLPMTLAFNIESAPRLMSLFTGSPAIRTDRGIGVGSSRRAVRRAYPSARLVHGGLGGGLASFYLVRHRGHALAFQVGAHRVGFFGAFANPHRSWIASEVCA